MALTIRSRAVLLVTVAVLLPLLAYLRDPPWLHDVTTGLGAWQVDETGERYRWTGARASFFVPADSTTISLTMRALNDTPEDWPINAMITVDDRPAQLVPFPDESWRTIRIRLPPPGERAVRRIDIHLDRVRRHQPGIQLREPRLDRQ